MEYLPQIIQVLPGRGHEIFLYFTDGSVRLYDAEPLLDRTGVFDHLKDPTFYHDRMTVMNGTLAWDITGTRDATQCLDLDPCSLYESSVVVKEPLATIA